MNEGRLLVVEDEPGWIDILHTWFEHHGYKAVEFAATGKKGIEKAIAKPPEVLLLDLVLPDMSGMEVCQKLRALPALARVPVILWTSHPREKVMGLQNGADYFVAKGEKPHELLATIDAAFRRKQTEEGVLIKGDLLLRASDRQIHFKGAHTATLSPKVFVLFHILVEQSPKPVKREELYRLVEGTDDPGLSRALDVMLNRLRKALPPDLSSRIANVKNFGYVFL